MLQLEAEERIGWLQRQRQLDAVAREDAAWAAAVAGAKRSQDG